MAAAVGLRGTTGPISRACCGWRGQARSGGIFQTNMPWNSVFRRYQRWVETGVFDAMLDTLSEMVERDTSADMIDSTVVRAHHCAVGLKKGIKSMRGSGGRAVASLPSSMLASTDKVDRSALS